MAKSSGQIRSVLIPITERRVLLPNATVAEVITFANPDPVADSPDWLRGRVVWRGWRVPVFSLSILAGWTERESEAGAKIAVMKALGGHKELPYIAMVTQGFPRLVTIDADGLEIVATAGQGASAKAQAGNDSEKFEVEMEPIPAGEEAVVPSHSKQEAAGIHPIQATVSINGEHAVVPNLQAIEQLILDVL